jgi:hypothetical protein
VGSGLALALVTLVDASRFHLRSATVTVRVDSHGKSVQLDGLISSRS